MGLKNKTKMNLMILGLVIFGVLAQYRYGNNGAWIIAGIILFSVGFGWYAGLVKGEK